MIATIALLASGGLATPDASAQGATQFVFQGAGWGHGVGMSQNGARNAAERGIDHVGILNYYYPNAIVSQAAPLGNIRVHIGDATRVELSSAGSITFERGGVAINAIPSGSITVSAHDGGLQIGNAWTTGSPSDPLYVTFPQPVKLGNNGHRYLWGKFQITNRNGKVRVVEDLPLEQYVAGIAEMPAAWPLEALMAQAIAARTYAHEITLHRRNSTEWAQEYDISGTTVDQNYIGYDAQDSAWDQKWLAAVSATAGAEIVDSNGPVRAYYSASNGGYTETAAYVFNNDVAHTVSGPDPYDAGGHDWTEWTRTYSQQSISRWFNNHADTSVGTLTAINVLGGAGASARLDRAVIELVGTAGTKRVTGKRMMVVMNAGIFGEGGGLGTHLPGTFTTIGNGVGAGAPQPSGAPIPTTVTPDPVAEGATENDGFTPPPGWKPEAGTGVPPGQPIPPTGDAETPENTTPAADADAEASAAFVPPADWKPEPGTGVPPGQPIPPVDNTADANAANDSNLATPTTAPAPSTAGYAPPPDWKPEPGTGVPPGQAQAPLNSASTQAAPENAAAPTAESAPTGEAAAAGEAASTSSFTPPAGWQPEAGTGVPPGQPVAPLSDTETVGGTGGGDALASGVFLVTRTADATAITDAKFEVIAPTSDLAAEARQRLQELQAKAAVGLFADVDVDGYVASVAPRPVHGICTATADGVTCVPLEALQASDN